MRLKKNPFGSIKETPAPVVKIGDGSIWFLRRGCIEPNTNPIALQEKQQKQAEISVLILEAAENLAKEKGVTPEQAREMLFPREVDGVTVEPVNLLDFLTEGQKTRYFALVNEAADIPLKVATLMIRHRILYSITLSEPAKLKATQIYVDEPWFDVTPGQTYKTLDGVLIRCTAPYDPETGAIGIDAMATALPAGSLAFLTRADGKFWERGNPEWTDEQTQEFLTLESADGSPSQIDQIYRFYLEESGRAAVEEAPVDEGKPQTQSRSKKQPSLESSNQIQSIGEESSGDCNISDAQMNGSAQTSLEAALIG